MHDHHCDVVQVCVCAKNYKYFILFMFHAGAMFLNGMLSMIVLHNGYNNPKLNQIYNTTYIAVAAIFGIVAAILLLCPLIFLCQSPLVDDTGEMEMIRK